MSKRTLIGAVAAFLAAPNVAGADCDVEPDLTVLPATQPVRRAFVDVLNAAWKFDVSEKRLWDLANARSGGNPWYYGRVGPTEYRGLYAFQTTQFVETLAGMGWSVLAARQEDVWQSGVQAEAAAHLLKVGRPIRGEPPR